MIAVGWKCPAVARAAVREAASGGGAADRGGGGGVGVGVDGFDTSVAAHTLPPGLGGRVPSSARAG